MSTSSDGPADPAAASPPPVASSPATPVEHHIPDRTASPAASLEASARGCTGNAAPSSVLGRGIAPFGARNGDLTPRWRYVLAAAWVIAFFAYAAIWQASVEIGIGTWWIGPRAQPTHTVVRVLPSLLSISMAMCAIYNVPRLLRVSAAGVVLATCLAIPDFSRSIGLGVAELVIAGLLGLVTAAALSGRYRLVPGRSDGDLESGAEQTGALHDQAGDSTNVPHDGAGHATDRDVTDSEATESEATDSDTTNSDATNNDASDGTVRAAGPDRFLTVRRSVRYRRGRARRLEPLRQPGRRCIDGVERKGVDATPGRRTGRHRLLRRTRHLGSRRLDA